MSRLLATDIPSAIDRQCGVWTKPLARRTLRVRKLRQVGIEPPKWHDVGDMLREYRQRYPPPVAERIDRLAQISSWLRKEREFAFSG